MSDSRIESADGADPNVIRSRIADTRAEMDRTLDELGERLDPRNLIDQVIDFFRSESPSSKDARRALGSAGRSLATTVREHPMPSLLVGAGLGWMLLERRGISTEDQGENGDKFSGVREKVSDVAETIGEKTSATLHRAAGAARGATEFARGTSERVADAARRGTVGARDSLRHGYDRARHRTAEVLDDYPLGAAAGAMAFGILAGLLLPPTRAEDRVLGETADTAKRRMRAQGERIFERSAQAVAAAVEAASEEVGQQDLATGELAAKAKTVAKRAFGAAMGTESGRTDLPQSERDESEQVG